MEYRARLLESPLHRHLRRGKSVLLLGPRQTGKSTLLQHLSTDRTISLLQPAVRQRYEKDPSQFGGEIEALAGKLRKRPLVVLDEIQKVPLLLDVVQDLIDRRVAQFILTGSSARKLRRGQHVNLLPGRLVSLRLDPFTYEEYPHASLESLLLDGSLPVLLQAANSADRETDLRSYVETYLEEEIRAEAVVRQVGHFARFLEYAGLESGGIINYRSLAQEIGVSHTTVAGYFEILEDCLIAERIDPITRSATRKKLTQSSRYLLFDLGVRRLCANEGRRLSRERMGTLFEQWVGLELVRTARLRSDGAQVRFWRDPDGPEVDWILQCEDRLIPIEVKYTATPRAADARHLAVFLREYRQAHRGVVICQTPHPVQLTEHITALPWQQLTAVFAE